MSKNVCGLALVGSGNIAQVHAQAIALVPEARLVAVYGRNPQGARDLANGQGARYVTSLEELVAAPDVEGVLIATPSGAHLEPTLASLSAGKGVLCEKPLEITLARAAMMVETAERTGRILAGFFPMRVGEGARTIRQALDEGRFGRVTLLHARVKWWRDSAYYATSTWRGTPNLDGGGALMNQGIHAVDLLQWLGGRIVEVSAFADTLAHPGLLVEDTLAASFRFESGALGTIEASTACYPGLDLTLEICGDRGTAILVNDRIAFWRFADERPEDETRRSSQGGGKIRGGAGDPKAISCEGHRQQIAAFCAALQGRSADLITGHEATAAVAIIEATYRAVQSGHREEVCYLS
jgi:predicted dehydrogenase